MRASVAITLAVCTLPLMGCSRWFSCAPEPPALAPQQYETGHTPTHMTRCPDRIHMKEGELVQPPTAIKLLCTRPARPPKQPLWGVAELISLNCEP